MRMKCAPSHRSSDIGEFSNRDSCVGAPSNSEASKNRRAGAGNSQSCDLLALVRSQSLGRHLPADERTVTGEVTDFAPVRVTEEHEERVRYPVPSGRSIVSRRPGDQMWSAQLIALAISDV